MLSQQDKDARRDARRTAKTIAYENGVIIDILAKRIATLERGAIRNEKAGKDNGARSKQQRAALLRSIAGRLRQPVRSWDAPDAPVYVVRGADVPG